MVDPFDFSDFGSPRTNGRTAVGPSPSESKLHTGFDPFGETHSGPVTPVDAFGMAAATSDATQGISVARPPLNLFVLAIALAAAGVLIAGIWGNTLIDAALGWLLAGPVAIGVLAIYTLVDTRRRTDAVYSAPSWTGSAYWVVIAVCLAGIAIGAWHLALWAGRA